MNTFANVDYDAPLPIEICIPVRTPNRTLLPLPESAPSLAEVRSALFAELCDADARYAYHKQDPFALVAIQHDAKLRVERLQAALQVINELAF